MARIESVIQVKKQVEDVFAFMNVAENHARFIPNMVEFKQTSAGAFGRDGATANGLLRYLGIIMIPVSYEIIEHDLNHTLTMKGKMGPVFFKDGYVLSPSANGAQIKFWLELNPTGWTKLFSPFAELIGKVHGYETLRNLKKELEIWQPSSSEDASQLRPGAKGATPRNT
jgi:hypothetical protein